jgi:hypothetical protein
VVRYRCYRWAVSVYGLEVCFYLALSTSTLIVDLQKRTESGRIDNDFLALALVRYGSSISYIVLLETPILANPSTSQSDSKNLARASTSLFVLCPTPLFVARCNRGQSLF